MKKRKITKEMLDELAKILPVLPEDECCRYIGGNNDGGDGSMSNPYTWQQYEVMYASGSWRGGFVRVGEDKIEHIIPDTIVTAPRKETSNNPFLMDEVLFRYWQNQASQYQYNDGSGFFGYSDDDFYSEDQYHQLSSSGMWTGGLVKDLAGRLTYHPPVNSNTPQGDGGGGGTTNGNSPSQNKAFWQQKILTIDDVWATINTMRTNSSLTSKIFSKFQKTPRLDLEFRYGTNPPKILARTIQPNNQAFGGELGKVIIQLDIKAIEGRSRAAVVNAIAHELIHAEIDRKLLAMSGGGTMINLKYIREHAKGGLYPELAQAVLKYPNDKFSHEYMARHHIKDLMQVIQEMFPEISEEDREALVWDGLHETSAFQEIPKEKRTRMRDRMKELYTQEK